MTIMAESEIRDWVKRLEEERETLKSEGNITGAALTVIKIEVLKEVLGEKPEIWGETKQ